MIGVIVGSGLISFACILTITYFAKYTYWDTSASHIAILVFFSLVPALNLGILLITLPEIHLLIQKEEVS